MARVPGSVERLREASLRRRVRELEEELRRLRGELAALRDWLEEVEAKHAVLTVKLYDVKLDVGEGGEA